MQALKTSHVKRKHWSERLNNSAIHQDIVEILDQSRNSRSTGNTSDNGRHTFRLIPKVSLDMYHLTLYTANFLTGHVLSITSWSAQVQIDESMARWTLNHAYHNFTLTAHWYNKHANTSPKRWLQSILSSPTFLSKFKHRYQQIIQISHLTS